MRTPRNLSVGQKLTFIALVTSGVALTLAFVGFMAHEIVVFRENMLEEHAGVARMLSENTTAALTFNDVEAAAQTLRSVGVHDHVRVAVLYDQHGRIFASYERPGVRDIPMSPPGLGGGSRWSSNAFELEQPVMSSGDRIGTIYLRSNLDQLRERIWMSGLITLVLLLASAGVAYLVTRRLRHLITGPVLHLADVAQAVATERNYAVRARKQSDDELGGLVDTFNTMLDQIERGDRALRDAHDRLEERVAERTRELQQEIAERRRSEAAVSESNQRFEIVTRATTDAVWDWDAATDTLWWNDNYEAQFGYPRGRWPTRIEQWRELVHPDDAPQVSAGLEEALRGDGSQWWAEYRYRRSDGSYSVVFDRAYILRDASGRLVRMIGAMQDITERRRAQEQVAEEKARLQLIFETVPVGICLDDVGADGVRTERFLNDAHLRICGLTRAQAVDGIFGKITHPVDHATQLTLRAQLDRGEIERFSLEKRYIRPNGEVVWVVFSLLRRPNGRGGSHYLSTVVDITDLKRAQEQVASERERFKFIFESVPVGISLLFPGSNDAAVANPAHQRITGVPVTDLDRPDVFQRATHPDDYERGHQLMMRYKAGEIDRFTLEKRYLHPDGRIVWATLARRLFTDSATGRKMSITTVVDISELKAAQEQAAREQARFKFIFEAVPVGISLVDPDAGKSQLVNPAHVRITGVSREASCDPDIFATVSHPDDYRRQRELVKRYRAGEIDHFTIEKRYLHPGGGIVWAALTSRLFTDPATGRQQSVTTLVDITERKEAEARLAETHRQLIDSSRQAGMAEVATGVLHNVGNVLNSVNVSATLLGDLVRQSKGDRVAKLRDLLAAQEADLGGFFARDPRGRQVPGYLQTLASHLARERGELLAEIESLRKNIEHIKDIVSMQQNYAKVSGVSETVTVAELLEDALRMTMGTFERHNISLVREYDAAPVITVQKHKVLQILVNILRNAKFACVESSREDRRVTLRVMTEPGRVRIAVCDNGVGIPAENLTRIFAHGFTTRRDGHGFGLHSGAIAARELGGALTAQSAGRGHGATFILELPENFEVKAA